MEDDSADTNHPSTITQAEAKPNMEPESLESFPDVLAQPHEDGTRGGPNLGDHVKTNPNLNPNFKPIVEVNNLDIEGTPLPPLYPKEMIIINTSALKLDWESLSLNQQQKIR